MHYIFVFTNKNKCLFIRRYFHFRNDFVSVVYIKIFGLATGKILDLFIQNVKNVTYILRFINKLNSVPIYILS